MKILREISAKKMWIWNFVRLFTIISYLSVIVKSCIVFFFNDCFVSRIHAKTRNEKNIIRQFLVQSLCVCIIDYKCFK